MTRAAQASVAGSAEAAQGELSPDMVRSLQQQAGNQATSDLIESPSGSKKADGRDASTPAASAPTATSDYRGRFAVGQHGYKQQEQKELSGRFDVPVTGKTHESEHTIGWKPLSASSDLVRGQGQRARDLENTAPAYQEQAQHHHDHIGTYNRKQVDASGFSGTTYRDSQRRLIEQGDVSSAVQLNQLGYAFTPGFQQERDGVQAQIADASYDRMVDNLTLLPFASGDSDDNVEVDATQQAEMYLARRAAETGVWPSAEDIAEAKRRYGLG